MTGLRASESLHSYPNQLIAEVIANAQQILQAAVDKLKKNVTQVSLNGRLAQSI